MSDRRLLLPSLILVAAGAGWLGGQFSTQPGSPLADVLVAPARAAGLPAAVDGQPIPSLAPMLERVMPAVVNVYTASRVQVRPSPFMDDPFFRHFFGIPDMPRERVERSLGSGVIVDAGRGLVVTNHHVIEAADDISVTLADGRTLVAERVGADPATDIAVIRIPAEGLVALPLAQREPLRVGDFVVAVGNPFGLGQTVTSGIVSALGRGGLDGRGVQNFIQTDASINPGNSGGALVNLRGELVGINTAIYSRSGDSAGIGFAIPSTLTASVLDQLVEQGAVRRGSLGVEVQDLDAALAASLGAATGAGVAVTRIQAGGTAARAGVQVGDVITALNGTPVRSGRELRALEGMLPGGGEVALVVLRDGRERRLAGALVSALTALVGDTADRRLAGAEFAPVPERLAARGVRGALASAVAAESPAGRAGLRRGDVVLQVNGTDLDDLEALRAALVRAPAVLSLTILRGNRLYKVDLTG
ncbi:MAG: trypsin-like peptidase domain-containing protein [Pseudoxanthomonas sp.]|nr:trypsin-like peptidase domain-containing protein [Pseudoxanthomonas sp.]